MPLQPMLAADMLHIDYAFMTDPGQRQSNEDALLVSRRGSVAFAVLADGAGGHQGGAFAARTVVSDIHATLAEHHSGEQTRLPPAELTRIIRRSHQRLQQRQVGVRGVDRMHTTVAVLWLHARHELALWSHVGDSRLYRLRYGRIDHISTDDTVVQRLLAAGLIQPDEARSHPARHQLSTAIGVEEDVQPHTLGTLTRLEDGDAFLLCSDGWWEPLGAELITQLYHQSSSPRSWLVRMQQAIRARNARHQDNYSAVALWVDDPTLHTQGHDDTGPGAPR